MIQHPEHEPGVEKLDGYKIDVIKKIKGTKCCYCHKSKAMSTCAYSNKCKSKIFTIFSSFMNNLFNATNFEFNDF